MRETFHLVGPRPLPPPPPQPKAPWYRGKPIPAAVVLSAVLLGCLFCEAIMTADPTYLDLTQCSLPPSGAHYFGTDTMGRDIFSMIWYGGRISLTIGALSTVLSTLLAMVIGTLSGLAPRWLDQAIMRCTEILLSIPNLLLVIMLQAILGQASVWTLSLVIGVTGWTSIAKVVRTEVRQLRNSEYVLAARSMGGGFFYILFRHLAPNFLSSILFMVVMNFRSAVLSESTLSFIGMGLPVEIISWGSMLSLAEKALLSGSWWIILTPGLFLVAVLMSVTSLGGYLRQLTDRRAGNL